MVTTLQPIDFGEVRFLVRIFRGWWIPIPPLQLSGIWIETDQGDQKTRPGTVTTPTLYESGGYQ